MNKKYHSHFDYEEVSGGAIITEYDEDTPIVSFVEDGSIAPALGNLLYSEINEGAGETKVRVTITIEKL